MYTRAIDPQGWWRAARRLDSPNQDARPGCAGVHGRDDISLVVVHAISLPAGEFGSDAVPQLFQNCLDCQAHPSFSTLAGVRVSAHFFLRRDGLALQFVSIDRRAWHAGVSVWQGRERCNDYSIGIELEGSDSEAFTPVQYAVLNRLLAALVAVCPIAAVVGHSDVAPGRKTDPGPFFDWNRVVRDRTNA